MREDDLKECDCCGKMKPDVRASFLPHAGDTNACAQCRGEDGGEAMWELSDHDDRPHYNRYVEVGPLSLRLSVWPIDGDCTEWTYAFQGRSSECVAPCKTAERAMRGAEVVLAGYLRRAARLVAASPSTRMIDNEPSRPETGQYIPGHAGVSVAAVSDLQAGGLSERDRELRPHGVGASPSSPPEPRDPSAHETSVDFQAMRAEMIEECAKWHDAQFDKYAKLAKEAADLQDMTSNGFHADTAQHHMISAAALRTRKALRN